MNFSPKDKQKLIKKGFAKLKNKWGYGQVIVVDKLNYLGFNTNTTAMSHVLGNKKEVSESMLNRVFEGFIELMKKEMCMEIEAYDTWERIEDCELEKLIIPDEEKENNYLLHEQGRLGPADKIRFLSTAQKEIIEFGLTLNTFSNYFVSFRGSIFKNPIIQLLREGVNIKCYILDEKWNGTSFYFSDRETAIKESLTGIEKIRSSLRKLKTIISELDELKLEGKIEVFKYRHIPHNSFLIVDPNDRQNGKMMVSNYLFAHRRADCPVLQFERKDKPLLFQRYLDSFNKITKNAKKVDFSKISD